MSYVSTEESANAPVIARLRNTLYDTIGSINKGATNVQRAGQRAYDNAVDSRAAGVVSALPVSFYLQLVFFILTVTACIPLYMTVYSATPSKYVLDPVASQQYQQAVYTNGRDYMLTADGARANLTSAQMSGNAQSVRQAQRNLKLAERAQGIVSTDFNVTCYSMDKTKMWMLRVGLIAAALQVVYNLTYLFAQDGKMTWRASMLGEFVLIVCIMILVSNVGKDVLLADATELNFCAVDQNAVLLKIVPIVWLLYSFSQLIRFGLFQVAYPGVVLPPGTY